MRLFYGALLIGLVLLCSGCLVMSLHPFFTDSDALFEKSLVGTWTDKNGGTSLTFKQFGANAYKVTYVQREISSGPGGKKEAGEPGEFEGHLGRINGVLLLDLYPDQNSWDRLRNDLLAIHLAPTHTISKVWFEGEKLMIARLDHDWLKDLTSKNSAVVAHEKVEDAFVLTASTAGLQQFLTTCASDPKAFGTADEFHRQ